MEIAIDSGPLESGHAVRGVGVNTKELIDALKLESSKDIKINAVDFSKTELSKYDLAHYTAFHPYFPSIPKDKPSGKVVLTIHDLIYLIYPDKYPAGIKGKVNYYKNKYRLKNVDAVLTISETSKKDIVRFLNIPEGKIKAIHLAAKDVFKPVKSKSKLQEVKKKYNLPDKFVLFVGDTNYNKNLPKLINAAQKAGIPLVIVGKKAAELDKYIDNLRSLVGPRDYLRYVLGKDHPELVHYKELVSLINKTNVITPGFVPDEELIHIYNLASVYVQPSLYEGFGLTVLEAMACGTPVIVTKTNALVEIAGDAALTADPQDVDEIAEQIKRVVNDNKLQKELSQKGLIRASEFSWKKTASETLRFYKQVINGS